MIPPEDLVTIARAINRSRPQGWRAEGLRAEDAQVDRTARAVADALWPHPSLVRDCTRRTFLISAGVDERASIIRSCGPKSGCASDPIGPF
jgi:hypothetical protein